MKKKESRRIILISDKLEFKVKSAKQDKETNYTMIKGIIDEEQVILKNPYASTNLENK